MIGPIAPPTIWAEKSRPKPVPRMLLGVKSTKIEFADGKIPEKAKPQTNCIRANNQSIFGRPCIAIKVPATIRERVRVL